MVDNTEKETNETNQQKEEPKLSPMEGAEAATDDPPPPVVGQRER